MEHFTTEIGIQTIATLRALKATNQIELQESIRTLNEEIQILYGLKHRDKRSEIIKKANEYYSPILKKFHEKCIQNAKLTKKRNKV